MSYAPWSPTGATLPLPSDRRIRKPYRQPKTGRITFAVLACRAMRPVAFLALASATLLATVAEGQNVAAEVVDLNWIGFQYFQDASRVFVRTTEPTRYRIVPNAAGDRVSIILENTQAPLENTRRPLDTSKFESPVRGIEPKVIEGPSPSVRVEISLHQKTAFKATQYDNVIAVDFRHP